MEGDSEEGQQYLDEKKLPQFFKALTIGLVHSRPENPIDFIDGCLEKARQLGENVTWDSFLPSPDSRQSPLPPIQDTRSKPTSAAGNIADVRDDGKQWQQQRKGRQGKGKKGKKQGEDKRRQGKDLKDRGEDKQNQNEDRHSHEEDQLNHGEDRLNHGEASGKAMSTQRSYESQQSTRSDISEKPGYSQQVSEMTNVMSDEAVVKKDEGVVKEDEDDEEAGPDAVYSRLPEAVQRVLHGDMEDLPPMPSSTVRIFLSSTFSDFRAERNILPRKAYPALQKFCSERGLDFQVLDMRWGVTDDVMNDHQVSELCLREIKTCQQISCGPNFVTLVGLRYGYQPFPAVILSDEFKLLQDIIQNDLKLENAGILKVWFDQDTNAIPNVHILQPIDSLFPHYNDMREEKKAERADERQRWNNIFSTLRDVLRQAATRAHQTGKMDATVKEKYFISVTEEEIQTGLLEAAETDDRVLCYMRDLEGVTQDKEHTDIVPRFVDSEDIAVELRDELVLKKIPKSVKEDQMKKYKLLWTGKALEESDHQQHKEYLEKFANDFVSDIQNMISKRKQDHNEVASGVEKNFYFDVLHHLKFAKRKCEVFCGREDIIEKVKEYVNSTGGDKMPLVIHGKSGYGKTSLMSHIAAEAKSIIGRDVVTILRLMGTSPESTSIYTVLRSVIVHMCLVLGENVPQDNGMESMGDVRRTFWTLLHRIGRLQNKPEILLIMDSVDQLATSYGAHRLQWLPKKLPHNVHLVVSMLSDRFTCLENAKRRLNNEQAFLSIDPLPLNTGKDIMQRILSKNNRCLTKDQETLITNAFQKCAQPLFLKLVMDNALFWHSYSAPEETKVPEDVLGAISLFFENLEFKYGQVFTSHALGYLTCGMEGLGSIEIEDALSCDDEVLNEVYQYHDPPLDDTIRIPPLMWARLQHDTAEYLVERQVFGKAVLQWHHRQFREAAEERFVKPKGEEKKLHYVLAELYQQETGIKRTVILEKRKGKVMNEANRGVNPQALNVKNRRKLGSLPFHFRHSGQIKLLKSQCLANFNWLMLKIQGFTLNQVFTEYEIMCEDPSLENDSDIILIRDFIQMSYEALSSDPFLLANGIVTTLANCAGESELLTKFVADANIWIENNTRPHLAPTHDIQAMGADSPLRFSTMAGHSGILTKDESILVSQWQETNSNMIKFQSFSLTSRDLLVSHIVNKVTPFAMTPDDAYYMYIDGKFLLIREVETGDTFKTIKYREEDYEKATMRCMAMSKKGNLLAMGVKYGKPKGAVDNKWKSLSQILILDIHQGVVTTATKWYGRKPMDTAFFVQDDKYIIFTSHEKLLVLDATDLTNEIHSLSHWDDIQGDTFQYLDSLDLVIGGVVGSKGSNVQTVIYRVSDQKIFLSQQYKPTAEGAMDVFAVVPNGDATKIISGYNEPKTASSKAGDIRNKLSIWDRENDSYSEIALMSHDFKLPKSLAIRKDWRMGAVGWENGDLSLVNMEKGIEANVLKAHGHIVNMLRFIRNQTMLLSMSQDHYMKLWDVFRLEKVMDTFDGEVVITTEKQGVASYDYLDINEQGLDISITNTFLMSAPPDTKSPPKFWDLEKAVLLKEKTDPFKKEYVELFNNSDVKLPLKSHGTLTMYGEDNLAYIRKIRDGCSLHIRENVSTEGGHFHLTQRDVFSLLITDKYIQDLPEKTFTALALSDGELIIFKLPTLEKIKAIEVPKLSEDIPNLQSSGGKKKLSFMRYGITVDGAYYVVFNPSGASGVRKKYFDLIDLTNGKYIKRVDMVDYTPWKLMACGLSLLVTFKKEDEPSGIFIPSRVQSVQKSISQKIIIESDGFISEDLSLGLEVTKFHKIMLWKLTSKKLYKKKDFRGHRHEVICADFSKDNRFVVSGSYDSTVRIWSTRTGGQICMFHTNGAVTKAMASPNMEFIGVHCFSAPQRKRAMILKVWNLNNMVEPEEAPEAEAEDTDDQEDQEEPKQKAKEYTENGK